MVVFSYEIKQEIEQMKTNCWFGVIICGWAYAGAAMAADATICQTLWPEKHCKTWTLGSEGSCTNCVCNCTACESGYTLTANEAGDVGTKTHGSKTYLSYNSCHIRSSSYSLCNSNGNPCRAPNITKNGQIYCAVGGGAPSNVCDIRHATGVYTLSKYCDDYEGVYVAGATGCLVYACETGYYPASDNSRCICAKGYYEVAPFTCEKCPEPGTTAGTDTAAITSCYVPAGSFTDAVGSGTYSGDCYYNK